MRRSFTLPSLSGSFAALALILFASSSSLVEAASSSSCPASSTTDQTKIIVPLYSWDEECWPELQKAAQANPTVPYVIILNPNSGPSLTPTDPALACVPKLRSVLPKSSILVGYVRTGFGDRSLDDVESDVSQYAQWKNIKVKGGSTAKLDGIFFDETDWEESQSRLNAFSQLTTRAFGRQCPKVVLNPGTAVSDSYFNKATYVVDYESAYNEFNPEKLPTSENLLKKSVVMVHDVPDSTPLSTFLGPLVSKKVGAVFATDLKIGDEDVYAKFGSRWGEFVQEVATLNA